MEHQGEVTPIGSIVTTAATVGQQSDAQKDAVNALNFSVNMNCRTMKLGGVKCEVKGQRLKISVVNGQTTKKSQSRS